MSESNGWDLEGPDGEPEESPRVSPGSGLTGSPAGQPAGQPTRHSTGHPAVDSVLESLDRLDHTPVSEHVAVFESAHEALRAALSDAGTDQTS